MTFILNQDHVIYQNDLGENTAEIVGSFRALIRPRAGHPSTTTNAPIVGLTRVVAGARPDRGALA